ncbi:hypothetical protein L1765_00680 [Microaerobacter geothermalis]|uniref:hypothetical protein n=1 Tax=Microaerobacter geothermalis TaxID=674972 RepID=UPI001F25BABC|nr:hypothetical protein [Microaerobacter geothermalis]MCF6092506.1 hypothetical protein [Microaerobacter geothermalis]
MISKLILSLLMILPFYIIIEKKYKTEREKKAQYLLTVINLQILYSNFFIKNNFLEQIIIVVIVVFILYRILEKTYKGEIEKIGLYLLFAFGIFKLAHNDNYELLHLIETILFGVFFYSIAEKKYESVIVNIGIYILLGITLFVLSI